MALPTSLGLAAKYLEEHGKPEMAKAVLKCDERLADLEKAVVAKTLPAGKRANRAKRLKDKDAIAYMDQVAEAHKPQIDDMMNLGIGIAIALKTHDCPHVTQDVLRRLVDPGDIAMRARFALVAYSALNLGDDDFDLERGFMESPSLRMQRVIMAK